MNYLSVTVDSECRKTSTSGMTLAQNSSDNVISLYTPTKYSNVTIGFRFPTGTMFYLLHMAFIGFDSDTSLYQYSLKIPYSVTNFTMPSATARLSVSFHCWKEDDFSKGGEAVCDTSIVVNRSSNTDVYDPSYNGTDIENLWRSLGNLTSEVTEGVSLVHLSSSLPVSLSNFEDGTILLVQSSSGLLFYRIVSHVAYQIKYALDSDLAAEVARATAIDNAQETRLDNMDAEEATHIHTKATSDGKPYADYSNVGTDVSQPDNLLPTHADSLTAIQALQAINASLVAYCHIGDANKESIDNILNGTTPVAKAAQATKAENDGSGHPINALAYGTRLTLTYVQTTGVITAHLFNQNGVEVSTADYNLPTELIFDDEGYDATRKVLWFHPTGNPSGDNIEIDVTDLFDVYTGGSTSTISVSVANNVITASIVDGSITLAKLDSTFQTTWNQWTTDEATRATNETTRQTNEAARVATEAQRVSAETARENSYLFYKDSEGRPCVELSNWATH